MAAMSEIYRGTSNLNIEMTIRSMWTDIVFYSDVLRIIYRNSMLKLVEYFRYLNYGPFNILFIRVSCMIRSDCGPVCDSSAVRLLFAEFHMTRHYYKYCFHEVYLSK